MPVRAFVRPSTYLDSVALLRVAQDLRARPGVREAAALMGTPANHELVAAAGLATVALGKAGPGDLIVSVDAESEALAEAALEAADALLGARRPAVAGPGAGSVAPRTLESARRRMPEANLAVISVPGAYAAAEARRALQQGLHVFLFSDHVTLQEEIRLKLLAITRGLLCMGPDCGTAYLNGIGLGFANVVPRGRVGIVAASGTGLQAVASHLAALGEGISQGIGVGGRDLSAAVGGRMTIFALEALARDPATALVILVSKPPAAALLPRIESALAALGKPAVVCCLGAPPRPDGPGRWVATLDDAAAAAVAGLRGREWQPRAFSDPGLAKSTLIKALAAAGPRGRGLLGLYSGGSLAYEAKLVLEPLLGPVASNLEGHPPQGTPVHEILDLGADEFTVSRPHPMLDPAARAARIRAGGRTPHVGVMLLDLVLGRGAHPDPAAPLAAAIQDAREAAAGDGRALDVVVAVIGTEADPQDLGRQVAALDAAGAHVASFNAQAARLAALILRPELAPTLLTG